MALLKFISSLFITEPIEHPFRCEMVVVDPNISIETKKEKNLIKKNWGKDKNVKQVVEIVDDGASWRLPTKKDELINDDLDKIDIDYIGRWNKSSKKSKQLKIELYSKIKPYVLSRDKYSNGEIAELLEIGKRTVESYSPRIKAAAKERLELP